MPRNPSLLLRAARCTLKREDRLTELLAVVLDGHLDFAHGLLKLAGLPALGDVEVLTQHRTARGKFVDMRIRSLDSHGNAAGLLWSEHKTGSPYSSGQMEGYANDLGLSDDRKLITIVDGPKPPPDKKPWQTFTWRDIAVLASQTGRDLGGQNWREEALSPHGPAQQRLLLELLSYLEEIHGTVVDPMTQADVDAFATTSKTHKVLFALLDCAAHLPRYEQAPKFGIAPDRSHYWLTFKSDGIWAEPRGGWLELTVAESDGWTGDKAHEPVCGAGFALPPIVEEELRSDACQSWCEEMNERGFIIRRWGNRLRVYRTKRLAELTATGPTIDLQAQELADWADETFAILRDHNPPLPTWSGAVVGTLADAATLADYEDEDPLA
jgi:hypothetical protein